MTMPTTCGSCGVAVAPGATFCGSCGAAVVQAPQPEPAPPQSVQAACASCGAALAPGMAFCGSCGSPASGAQQQQPVQPPPQAPAQPPPQAPVQPAACASCGAPLNPGARFCRSCGAASGGAPATGVQPAQRVAQPAAAQNLMSQLTWSSAAAAVGFLIALISPFMAWVSVGGFSADPFDTNARFRIADWMSTDNADGYLVLFVAAGGLAALIAWLLGRLPDATGRSAVMGIGGLLAALGVLEMQFIASQDGISFSNVGFGLYMLLIGGALAAASPWIPANKLTSG